MDGTPLPAAPPPLAAAGDPHGVGLVHGPIDAQALLESVASANAGGTVLFLGTTRGRTGDVITRGLDYEAHEPLAAGMIATIRLEALGRFGLVGCAVVHRLGRVEVGEASIAIATSAPHRRAAFAAAEWILERIKQEVPIWKCEEGEDGTRAWIHPGSIPLTSGGSQ